MHRNAEKDLAAWFADNDRKPLYMTGMRGTGKTTLICEFAASCKTECIYINFETNYDLRKLIGDSAERDPELRLADILGNHYGFSEEYIEASLIILEEIHLAGCGDTLAGMLMRHKGSLIFTDSEAVNEYVLNDSLHFKHITLRPLTFAEFLDANGREWYREVIEGHFERKKKVPDLIHNELNDIYADYMLTGGMPAVVNEYILTTPERRRYNIEELQYREYRNICESIRSHENEQVKVLGLLKNIASNMADGSYYYKFSSVRRGTSYPYYKNAVKSLTDCGIAIKTEYANKINLYCADAGIAGCLLKSEVSCSDETFDRCMRISCAAANLIKDNRSLYFWHSAHGAGVEFLFEEDGSRVPVKILNASGKNIRSLHVYDENNHPEKMFAVSEGNFNIMGRLCIIPQYAVFCL